MENSWIETERIKSALITRANYTLPSEELEKSLVVCKADGDQETVFVTDAFERHTGYKLSDVRGKNLRFLQGERTDRDAVNLFKSLIQARQKGRIELVNYRKDGTPFIHRVNFRPVFSRKGCVAYFIATQEPI